MIKHVIHASDAPVPAGPYSQAVKTDGFVFVSGQIGIDPATGALVPGGIGAQAARALKNLCAILAAAGCGPADVIRTDIALTDIRLFAAFNDVYAHYFFAPLLPARQTIESPHLPKNALCEISCIARKP